MFEAATVHTTTLVVSFLMFVAILAWTFSRSRNKSFEEAAQLPFDEDDDGTGRDNSAKS